MKKTIKNKLFLFTIAFVTQINTAFAIEEITDGIVAMMPQARLFLIALGGLMFITNSALSNIENEVYKKKAKESLTNVIYGLSGTMILTFIIENIGVGA